jgi:hypothetical protein
LCRREAARPPSDVGAERSREPLFSAAHKRAARLIDLAQLGHSGTELWFLSVSLAQRDEFAQGKRDVTPFHVSQRTDPECCLRTFRTSGTAAQRVIKLEVRPCVT